MQRSDPTRGSSSLCATGTSVVLSSPTPSTGQNPASSGYRRRQVGQLFTGTGFRYGPQICRTRNSSGGRIRGGFVVEDAGTARALFEDVAAHELLEEHGRQAHVAGEA